MDLHEAGVNQFSVSLDFPDERHNKFKDIEAKLIYTFGTNTSTIGKVRSPGYCLKYGHNEG